MCSHGESRGAREEVEIPATFPSSACLIFANILLTKVKSRAKRWALQRYRAKGVDQGEVSSRGAEMSRLANQSCNFPELVLSDSLSLKRSHRCRAKDLALSFLLGCHGAGHHALTEDARLLPERSVSAGRHSPAKGLTHPLSTSRRGCVHKA